MVYACACIHVRVWGAHFFASSSESSNEKWVFRLSVKSAFQYACVALQRGHVCSSLTEISPCPTVNVNEQYRFFVVETAWMRWFA